MHDSVKIWWCSHAVNLHKLFRIIIGIHYFVGKQETHQTFKHFLVIIIYVYIYVSHQGRDRGVASNVAYTIALRCTPIPLPIGQAGHCIGSLWQGRVALITGVGHCGSKSCTGATACTICRSSRRFTTADGYRKGYVKVLYCLVVAQNYICNPIFGKKHTKRLSQLSKLTVKEDKYYFIGRVFVYI